MARNRFTSRRTARIAGWTTASIAWAAAIGGRALGLVGPAAAAEPPEVPPPASVAVTTSVTESPAAVPALPDRGLVVIRTSAEPEPQTPTTVVRTVARQATSGADGTASGGGAVAPPPVAAPAPVAVPAPAASSGGS